MDRYLIEPKPLPSAIFTSQDVRDRASLFTASIYSVDSINAYKSLIRRLKGTNQTSEHPATHVMSAVRCMMLKPNHTGLEGPDSFMLRTDNDDDGEKWGSEKILDAMQEESVLDAVVVVKRFYGGILLGPARFSHIETCTREVCRLFKKKEELDGLVNNIRNLDAVLDGLREELAEITGTKATTKKQDYDEWTAEDIPKAKRILVARTKAIESLKVLIAKKKEEKDKPPP